MAMLKFRIFKEEIDHPKCVYSSDDGKFVIIENQLEKSGYENLYIGGLTKVIQNADFVVIRNAKKNPFTFKVTKNRCEWPSRAARALHKYMGDDVVIRVHDIDFLSIEDEQDQMYIKLALGI